MHGVFQADVDGEVKEPPDADPNGDSGGAAGGNTGINSAR